MMLPTHVLGGMVFALMVAYLSPEFGTVALVAGLLGGAFPDLDLYTGHRKTLHYPVYYSVLGLSALVAAVVFTSASTVAAAVFLLGAALHSVTDAFGGGLELRPWEGTSDRAVYDHYRGQWIAPRRWVEYDGSPGDLALSVLLAGPLLVTVDGALFGVVVATLGVAVAYTVLRRRLSRLAAVVVQDVLTPRCPDHLLSYVPSRYRDTEPK